MVDFATETFFLWVRPKVLREREDCDMQYLNIYLFKKLHLPLLEPFGALGNSSESEGSDLFWG